MNVATSVCGNWETVRTAIYKVICTYNFPLAVTSSRGAKERSRTQRAMWRQAVTQTIFYTVFIMVSMPLIVGVGVFAYRRQKSTRQV